MQMEIQQFIDNYREAFTDKAPLPVAFWYSHDPLAPGTGKIGGCRHCRCLPERHWRLRRTGSPLGLRCFCE